MLSFEVYVIKIFKGEVSMSRRLIAVFTLSLFLFVVSIPLTTSLIAQSPTPTPEPPSADDLDSTDLSSTPNAPLIIPLSTDVSVPAGIPTPTPPLEPDLIEVLTPLASTPVGVPEANTPAEAPIIVPLPLEIEPTSEELILSLEEGTTDISELTGCITVWVSGFNVDQTFYIDLTDMSDIRGTLYSIQGSTTVNGHGLINDCDELVYADHGVLSGVVEGLYTLDTATGVSTQITANVDISSIGPVTSDGNFFTKSNGNYTDLYVYNITDHSNPTETHFVCSIPTDPIVPLDWSPDGSDLLAEFDHRLSVFSYADGNQCAQYNRKFDAFHIRTLRQYEGIHRTIWSPNGEIAVFTRESFTTPTQERIYILSSGGTVLRSANITGVAESIGTISPDGQYLTFERGNAVYLLNLSDFTETFWFDSTTYEWFDIVHNINVTSWASGELPLRPPMCPAPGFTTQSLFNDDPEDPRCKLEEYHVNADTVGNMTFLQNLLTSVEKTARALCLFSYRNESDPTAICDDENTGEGARQAVFINVMIGNEDDRIQVMVDPERENCVRSTELSITCYPEATEHVITHEFGHVFIARTNIATPAEGMTLPGPFTSAASCLKDNGVSLLFCMETPAQEVFTNGSLGVSGSFIFGVRSLRYNRDNLLTILDIFDPQRENPGGSIYDYNIDSLSFTICDDNFEFNAASGQCIRVIPTPLPNAIPDVGNGPYAAPGADWLRGIDRGWDRILPGGYGACDYGNEEIEAIIEPLFDTSTFQKNPCRVFDWLIVNLDPPDSETKPIQTRIKVVEQEEAAADMFLNWVYRLLDETDNMFVLVDVDAGQDLRSLVNGSIINLHFDDKLFNIRANISPDTVGSLVFQLTDPSGMVTARTENTPPYELGPRTLSVGSYTLTVTPYNEADAGGTSGTPLILNFTVVDDPSSGSFAAFSDNEATVPGIIGGVPGYFDTASGAGDVRYLWMTEQIAQFFAYYGW